MERNAIASTAGRRPLSGRERELLGMPTIASQFPVPFSNGKEFTKLTGYCLVCGLTILPQNLHGIVTRPIPGMAVVEALGVCHDCRVCTSFLYRLYDDMRFTGPRNGGWHEWKLRLTVWGHVIKAFRRLKKNMF